VPAFDFLSISVGRSGEGLILRAVPWVWALPPAMFVKSEAGARNGGLRRLLLQITVLYPDFVATNTCWAIRNNRENFTSFRKYLQRML
jgi:hypothetical protein